VDPPPRVFLNAAFFPAPRLIHYLCLHLATHAAPVRIARQLECATLLLELGEAADDVWPALLDGRQQKMADDLQRAAQFSENAHNKAAAAAAAAAVASHGDEGESEGEGETEGESNGRSPGLALLHSHFMMEFLEFVEQFSGLFLDQNAARSASVALPVAASANASANASGGVKAITAAVAKMTRALFATYFQLAFAALKRAAAAAMTEARQDPFAPFVEDLRFFYEHVRRAAQLVPGARLLDKAGEIIEKALRCCVECVFGGAHDSIVAALRQLHARVVELVNQVLCALRVCCVYSVCECGVSVWGVGG
jgi:hypothetical protein